MKSLLFLVLLSSLSLADTVTPFEEITAHGFAVRIIDGHVHGSSTESGNDRESNVSVQGNDPMLVISKHFLRDRSISEALRIAHALSIMAMLPDETFGEKSAQIKAKLNARLAELELKTAANTGNADGPRICLLYTSPSPRDS